MIDTTTLALGIILLVGLAGGQIAALIKLPAVTGYIIAGLLIGPSFFDCIEQSTLAELSPVNDLALGVIAFTIGAELTLLKLMLLRRQLPSIFFFEATTCFIAVTVACYLVSGSVPLAVVLGALSLATAPAAIISILRQYHARGRFPRLLLSLVAIDNLFCTIGFGLVTVLLRVFFYQSVPSGGSYTVLIFGELVYTFLLSIFLGSILLFLNRLCHSDDKLLVLNLGVILLAVGIAEILKLSSILVAMILGIVVANFCKNHNRVIRLVNQATFPILVGFLTLAGIKLELAVITQIGPLAIVYIFARLIGKVLGARIGAGLCKSIPEKFRRNIGMALTPQAGVAIGLAVLAEDKLPIKDGTVITLILSAVIFFELIGPVLVKRALKNCHSIDQVSSI